MTGRLSIRMAALGLSLAGLPVLGLAPAVAQAPQSVPQIVAPAEQPPGTNEPGRYSFAPVDGGVMRLDTRTGAVSHCARRAAGWTCEAVADDRAVLQAEITRLATENERLAARVASLERQIELSRVGPPPVPPGDLPNAQRPPQPPPGSGFGRDLPSDAEVDRMMSFVERLFRRFMSMVQTLRPDAPPPAPPSQPQPTPNKI